MLKRLTGVLILIALFLPVFGVLIGISLAQQWMTEVNSLADVRLANINGQLATIDTTITTAQRRVEEAQLSLESARTTINDAQEVVATLIGTITVPDIVLPTVQMTIPLFNTVVDIDLPTIAGFTIDAPVVNDVREVTTDALIAAEGLTTAVDDVAALGEIPAQLRDIVNEASSFASDVRDASVNWWNQARPLIICGLIWGIGFYIALIWRWLRAAWRMMMTSASTA